jgi:hypothetical protein
VFTTQIYSSNQAIMALIAGHLPTTYHNNVTPTSKFVSCLHVQLAYVQRTCLLYAIV